MDRRYILLSSSNRNRNADPNPFEFTTTASTSKRNKVDASDFTSLSAPVLDWDLRNYFSATATVAGQYYWEIDGTVNNPVALTTTDTFIATMSAPIGASAPDFANGQYNGMLLYYNTTTWATVQSFLNNGDGTCIIVLDSSIPIITGDTFTIQTPFLNPNQIYCPVLLRPSLENTYTNYFLTEALANETHQITAYSATTGVFTMSGDYTLTPTECFISPEQRQLAYTILSTTADTITVSNDHPQYSLDILSNQYLFYYNAFPILNGRITAADASGVDIVFTVSGMDASGLVAGDFVYISLFYQDNYFPFHYFEAMRGSKTNARSETRVGKLELLTLQMPNQLLENASGGKPFMFPFLFVDIENLGTVQQTDQVIYANTPNLDNSLKKITFVVTVVPYSSYFVSDVFVQFQSNGMTMPFSIKQSDVLKITVRAPDGQVLTLQSADTSPPSIPDPKKQMTVVLAITFPSGAAVGGRSCHY